MTMSKQETTHVIGVHHVGLSARDPAALAAFYHDVLGLQVVGGSAADCGVAFLQRIDEVDHGDGAEALQHSTGQARVVFLAGQRFNEPTHGGPRFGAQPGQC